MGGMESSFALSPFELLALYVESGVDEAIGDLPVNRFLAKPSPEPARTPPPAPRPAAPAATGVRPQPMQAPTQGGAQLAAACSTLAELRQALENFDGLALRHSALTTVFADGNPGAAVMLIGEAPGHEEDVQGLPFVGKSGKLLDKMLASIGLSRSDSVYITNVLPWRPIENRSPSLEEVAVCRPFLMRHIELAAPKILILLGGIPAGAVLETSQGITRLRGQWQTVTLPKSNQTIPAMPTFHPSYLLRTPGGKRSAWNDLLEVKKRMQEKTGN